MSLLAQIEADLKSSMLARTTDKTGVLRLLKSAIKYASIEKGGAEAIPTDADVITVLRREVKKRQDSIQSYTEGARPDLAEKEQSELVLLQTYLPASLSAAELTAIVQAAIAEVGATGKAHMGAVMKVAQARSAGRADGKTLSQLVQKLLA